LRRWQQGRGRQHGFQLDELDELELEHELELDELDELEEHELELELDELELELD
jgi:hypothetical protein